MTRKGIQLPPVHSQFKPLTEDDEEAIEVTAFRALREVGMVVEHEEALRLADEIGCDVDHEKKTVHFPEHIIKEYTRKTPKTFLMAGRTPNNDIIMEGLGRKHYVANTSATSCVCLWDAERNEYVYRDAVTEDAVRFTRWFDALEDIDMLVPPILDTSASKVGLPEHVHEAYISLTENTKHSCFMNAAPASEEEWKYYIKLAASVVGDEETLRKRPIISGDCSVTPPLQLAHAACLNLLVPLKHGLPVVIGATNTPTTILNACQLVLGYAGALGTLTLHQAAGPGIGSIIIAWLAPMHMRYVSVNFAAPGSELVNAALVQMLHEKLRVPASQANWTNSKIPDVQMVYEQTLNIFFQIMCGVDLNANYNFNWEALNPESLIMVHDELLAYAKQLSKRFQDLKPSEENMAYDAIKEVGALGDYLKHPITIRNMHLQYTPKLADYRTHFAWSRDKISMFDRARARIKELDAYRSPPLPTDTVEKMKSIVKEADEKLVRR